MSTPMLFLFPNVAYTTAAVDFTYHYGAGFVGAALAGIGIDSEQYIDTQAATLEQLVARILAREPRIVGFTCYETNGYLVDVISRALKQARPELVVLVGGPVASFDDDYILARYQGVDIVVKGEAEVTIVELVPALLEGEPWGQVQGISFRHIGGIQRNPQRAFDRHSGLDHLASPYLEGILPGEAAPLAGLATTRGCQGVCAYCQFPAIFHFSFRQFSIERVMREVEQLKGHLLPGQKLVFWDDDFATNRQRLVDLCHGLVELGSVPFQAELRGDHVDAELVELLARAGMRQAHFGLESAQPATLRRVNRLKVSKRADPNLKAEKAYLLLMGNAVGMMKANGIKTSASVILGLPGENEDDVRYTLDFVEALGVNNYQHNIFWALSGTKLRHWAEQGKWGLALQEPDTPLKFSSTVHPFDTEAVPRRKTATWGHKGERLPAVLSGLAEGEAAWQDSCRDLLLEECFEPAAEFIDWAGGELPLATTFYLLHRQANWHHTKAAMNKAYRHHCQGQVNYHPVRLVDTASQSWARDQRSSHLIRLPYSEFYADLELPLPEKTTMSCIAICLDDSRQLDALRQHAAQAPEGLAMPTWMLSQAFSLVDACRWIGSPRGCASLFRVSLAGREISPCKSGPVVGRIPQSLASVRSKLADIYRQVSVERGCGDCPALDDCPCCPAIALDAVEHYCQVQQYRQVTDWLRLLTRLAQVAPKLTPLAAGQALRIWTSLAPIGLETGIDLDLHRGLAQTLRSKVLVLKDGGPGLVLVSIAGDVWRIEEGSGQLFACLLKHPGLETAAAWRACELEEVDHGILEASANTVREMMRVLADSVSGLSRSLVQPSRMAKPESPQYKTECN